MVNINQRSHCDCCGKELNNQFQHIVVYKSLRGSNKVYAHYCIECFNKNNHVATINIFKKEKEE